MTPFNLEIPEEYLSKLAEASVKNQKGYTALLEAKEREIGRITEKFDTFEKHLEKVRKSAETALEAQRREMGELKASLENALSMLQTQQRRMDDLEAHSKEAQSTVKTQQKRIDELQSRIEKPENPWAPHRHYRLSLDGLEALDTGTGLIWRRTVEPGAFTYEQALEHAARIAQETGVSWRVPTRQELESLIDKTRKNPAIDTFVFPDTPSSRFWSSSPYVGSTSFAWFVGFYDGYVYYDYRSYSSAVRLVRGG